MHLAEKVVRRLNNEKAWQISWEKNCLILMKEIDAKLTNLLKRTYLRRWIGTLDGSGNEAEVYHNNEGKLFSRRSNSIGLCQVSENIFDPFFELHDA